MTDYSNLNSPLSTLNSQLFFFVLIHGAVIAAAFHAQQAFLVQHAAAGLEIHTDGAELVQGPPASSGDLIIISMLPPSTSIMPKALLPRKMQPYTATPWLPPSPG